MAGTVSFSTREIVTPHGTCVGSAPHVVYDNDKPPKARDEKDTNEWEVAGRMHVC